VDGANCIISFSKQLNNDTADAQGLSYTIALYFNGAMVDFMVIPGAADSFDVNISSMMNKGNGEYVFEVFIVEMGGNMQQPFAGQKVKSEPYNR
jgi:hypothetical protein